jgi:hypothetical protein
VCGVCVCVRVCVRVRYLETSKGGSLGLKYPFALKNKQINIFIYMRSAMNFKRSMSRCLIGTAINFEVTNCQNVDSRDRAVQELGLKPLAFRDCRFETFQGQGGLSLVILCQVEVCGTDPSLVRMSL